MEAAIKTRPLSPEYEEGFTRAFGERKALPRTRRARYVWDPDRKEMVEVGADWKQTPWRQTQVVGDSHYDGLRSPIDGTPIDSRTKHRQYMKEHNLADAADFKGVWREAAEERKPGNWKERAQIRDQLGRAEYQQDLARHR